MQGRELESSDGVALISTPKNMNIISDDIIYTHQIVIKKGIFTWIPSLASRILHPLTRVKNKSYEIFTICCWRYVKYYMNEFSLQWFRPPAPACASIAKR